MTPIALATYIKSEKAEIAKENAAWAAHTGKGLLVFSKQESEKDAPSGVINLVSNSSTLYNFQPHSLLMATMSEGGMALLESAPTI